MHRLTSKLKGINRAIQNRHESAIVGLEALYRKFRTQPRLSLKDLIHAAHLHNRVALRTPELYLLVIGVMFLLVSTGSFAAHALWSEYTRHIFIGSILALSFLVPLVLNFVFMPLHMVGGLSLHLTVALHLTAATALITFSARHITTALTGMEVSPSLNVFIPVIGTLLFGGALLLMRNHNRVCYHCFNQRYPEANLESTLPEEKQGCLQAMEAQDHYVLFVTSNGEHLQRMTLTEAINMAPADSGLRVHRSHWVAKSQILDLVQAQQKYSVILRNGRHVPVGKAKVEAVRALL